MGFVLWLNALDNGHVMPRNSLIEHWRKNICSPRMIDYIRSGNWWEFFRYVISTAILHEYSSSSLNEVQSLNKSTSEPFENDLAEVFQKYFSYNTSCKQENWNESRKICSRKEEKLKKKKIFFRNIFLTFAHYWFGWEKRLIFYSRLSKQLFKR